MDQCTKNVCDDVRGKLAGNVNVCVYLNQHTSYT